MNSAAVAASGSSGRPAASRTSARCSSVSVGVAEALGPAAGVTSSGVVPQAESVASKTAAASAVVVRVRMIPLGCT